MEQLRNEKMARDGGGRRLDCDREQGGGGGGRGSLWQGGEPHERPGQDWGRAGGGGSLRINCKNKK